MLLGWLPIKVFSQWTKSLNTGTQAHPEMLSKQDVFPPLTQHNKDTQHEIAADDKHRCAHYMLRKQLLLHFSSSYKLNLAFPITGQLYFSFSFFKVKITGCPNSQEVIWVKLYIQDFVFIIHLLISLHLYIFFPYRGKMELTLDERVETVLLGTSWYSHWFLTFWRLGRMPFKLHRSLLLIIYSMCFILVKRNIIKLHI